MATERLTNINACRQSVGDVVASRISVGGACGELWQGWNGLEGQEVRMTSPARPVRVCDQWRLD